MSELLQGKPENIFKVKYWIDNVRPAFEEIAINQTVRRLSDNSIFSSDMFYYYTIHVGRHYFYKITAFHSNKREVIMSIYNDKLEHVINSIKHINNFDVPKIAELVD